MKSVLGNWKMNGSVPLVREFTSQLSRLQAELQGKVRAGLIPPTPYLAMVPANPDFWLGAQDVSEHESGAYTGEVSATMLKELGCDLVLVGHSERRQHYGDTLERVAQKLHAALHAGLMPVLCIGETQEERQAGQTFRCLKEQLDSALRWLKPEQLSQLSLAYEPVWAIGTGVTASPEEAQEVHAWLRQQLPQSAKSMQILYGGSVKADNAATLFSQPDIDGGLIGGASLEFDSFEQICRAAAEL